MAAGEPAMKRQDLLASLAGLALAGADRVPDRDDGGNQAYRARDGLIFYQRPDGEVYAKAADLEAYDRAAGSVVEQLEKRWLPWRGA